MLSHEAVILLISFLSTSYSDAASTMINTLETLAIKLHITIVDIIKQAGKLTSTKSQNPNCKY